MRLDEWFIRSFESHISWPVRLTAAFLGAQADANKAFDHRLQDWLGREQGWLYARHDQNQWREILDRAARTLCYVFANRLIFYESVRAKFPELAELTIPKAVVSASQLYSHFQKTFQKAVEATGDYETLFYPFENDWAGPLVFGHADAAEAWRSVLQNLQPFNFKLIPTDVLGGIFRRIIDPEERHKFGQHYTNEDLVDVVNAFCVRHAEDNVLDPTCGSGSFLVRAYQRKAWLKQDFRLTHCAVTHQDRLAQLYGVDISVFAAHLATLNLAARDINDEENYPRIRRGNFFEVAAEAVKNKPFCTVPRPRRSAAPPSHRRQSALRPAGTHSPARASRRQADVRQGRFDGFLRPSVARPQAQRTKRPSLLFLARRHALPGRGRLVWFPGFVQLAGRGVRFCLAGMGPEQLPPSRHPGKQRRTLV
jgi:hypothetical protein